MMSEIWERQPGEGSKAFEAFRLYLEMGYKRSVIKVAAMLGKKSYVHIYEWKLKYNWNDRILAYDNDQVKLKRESQKQALEKIAEKHLKQATSLRDVIYLPLQVLTKKLKKEKNAQGKEVIVPPEDLDNLSTKELLELIMQSGKFFDTMVKIERLSLGFPTEISKSETTIVNESDNIIFGDKTALDENTAKLLTELINGLVDAKNSKPVDNGSLHNAGTIPTGKTPESDK